MSDDKPLYTYDDIPLYAPIRYRGVSGCVIAKGPRTIPGSDRQAIRVALDDRPPGGEGTEYIIDKETTNKHLREKRTLWVDFEWALTGDH